MNWIVEMADEDWSYLAELLGMLDSKHVDERATAASLATAFLKAHGLTWDEIINDLFSLARLVPSRDAIQSIRSDNCIARVLSPL